MKRASLLLFLSACSTADVEPDRYLRLVASPDRVTFPGPGFSREVYAYGVLEDSAGREVYEALPETPVRVRADAPGESQLLFAAESLELAVEIEVLAGAPPFAASVEAQVRGEGDGFGRDNLPGVVLGPPKGSGKNQGSTDVVSLGLGGSITLGFDEYYLYDGPGPDLLVFENAFLIAGLDGETFSEPAFVALRAPNMADFVELPCDLSSWPFPGCAGVGPVSAGFAFPDVDPLDPAQAGGDAFDLRDFDLPEANAVRITDVNTATNTGINSGFDLDAIALVHAYPLDVVELAGPREVIPLRTGDTVPLPRFDWVRGDGTLIHAAAVELTADSAALELSEGLLSARSAAARATITARAGRFEQTVEYTIEGQ